MMAPAAILLDLDDTLMADGSAVDAALAATWKAWELDPPPDPTEMAALVRSQARLLWRAGPHYARARDLGISSWEPLWANFEEPMPGIPELGAWAHGYRHEAWRRAAVSCGVDDGGRVRDMAERFRLERRARCELYPGVADLLRALRGRARLGVVTNGMPELQRYKATAAGLDQLVDTIVVSGEVGCIKPDPRVFLAALDRLGVNASDAVMVGDNLARDVEGAAALGMRTVWVSAGRELPAGGARPTAVIDHVVDLAEVLDGWAA
jgi:putative hydrolase of the HAD superfamily